MSRSSNGKIKKAGKIKLPVVLYKQSELTVNGKKIKTQLSRIGSSIITQKAGENVATLHFKTPIWFLLLLCLSILAWLSLLAFGIFKYIKKAN